MIGLAFVTPLLGATVNVGGVVSFETVYDSLVSTVASTNPFSAKSKMVAPTLVRASETVPSKFTKLPPETVTSQTTPASESADATFVTVAVVPETAKSSASTELTASLKVTRKTSESASVVSVVGSCRVILTTIGGVVSEYSNAPISTAP